MDTITTIPSRSVVSCNRVATGYYCSPRRVHAMQQEGIDGWLDGRLSTLRLRIRAPKLWSCSGQWRLPLVKRKRWPLLANHLNTPKTAPLNRAFSSRARLVGPVVIWWVTSIYYSTVYSTQIYAWRRLSVQQSVISPFEWPVQGFSFRGLRESTIIIEC